MPKVHCIECGRDVGMHELEAKTVTKRDGFDTRYRCPYCQTDIENVAENLI
jgi:DNA-directed RNA polymerase subunit RPC12/RpoP